MANFTAGPGAVAGIDFTDFDLSDFTDGDGQIATATVIRIGFSPADYSELTGKFTYNAGGQLTGGTVNTIVGVENTTAYTVTGLSLSVAAVVPLLLNGNTTGVLQAVFAGNDSLTGSAQPDDLLGFNGNDTVSGLGGNDTLNGGAGSDSLIGGTGDDSMDGAAGNDTYDVDSTTDVAAEFGVGAAGGTDTVRSAAATYTLGANIENLILTGTSDINGSGNTLANTLTGNGGKNLLEGDAGKDKLAGGAGDDTLNGGADSDTLDGGAGNDSLDGGTGDDSMTGGAGDDVYAVDSLKDKVAETLANDKGGGDDTVRSSVTFTLGANLDNLVLLDSADPIGGTGNALDNELTGNSKDNRLSGLAGADTISGGDGNDTLDGGVGKDAMAGGKGDDSYVLDVADDAVTEAAGQGKDTVQAAFNIDLTNAAFANIENATLLGTAALSATGTDADDNALTGNTGANTLQGGDGADTLDGGKGDDSLKGGAGDDVYGVDSVKDLVAEEGGEGDDTLRSSITISLASYPNIENVELVGTGALNATGSDGVANTLIGNAGANKLDGLGGDDTMDGRGGNDTYFVDSSSDQVSEDTVTGGGTDTVISTASFELGDNIENLTLLGAAVTGTGNALKNTITGNDMANTLDGGADIDKLVGGKGDDVYFVDNTKDVVTESVAGDPGGKDTVNSSDSFVLGANVENLILTGNKNSTGTGNALNNEITGDDSNNALFGLAGNDTLGGGKGDDTVDGGTGKDDLTGGAGNDTYVLDSADDKIHEDVGDSGDTVAASFSIDLGQKNYDNIENATLLGSAALTATGDSGNNILTGNSGANTLTGLDGLDTLDGGGGVDSLDGGDGNDVYIADNIGEKIFDSGDDDADEVQAKISFSLANLATIENAMLLSLAAALNLTGNGLDNILRGNDGANKIDGADGDDSVGGAGGNDTLDGGGGNDTLAGGVGNDVYVARGGESIVEKAGEGIDTVQSAQTYSIAAFAEVESLTLTGTGNIDGTGNAGKNTLTGNGGQNALDGGAGADTMAGGLGNDTYTVDDAKDSVVEAANGGTDTVLSSLPTYTLPDNIENLTLTGSGDIDGVGNKLNNLLTGNDGANKLEGAAGNDTLGGGLGADELDGGAGTDTYLYATKDVQDVVNTGDNGLDRVLLVGSPYDFDVRRDGNDLLIQAIIDEVGENADFDPNQAIRIVGQYAGAGIAFFQGDFGEELNLFYGGNPDLTTVFTPSGLTGKDQGANAEVVEGTSADDVVNGGGGQSDFLYGNDGNDKVNSQSGADEFAFLSGGIGNDTLTGAAGTDRFRGDEGNDSIDGGAGFDRVSYFLSVDGVTVDLTKQGAAQTISASQGQDTFVNIEAANGSKHDDTLIGDGNGNTLIGLLGDDSISGGGGSDFLVGNEGNDTLAGKALDDFVEVSYDDAKVGVIVNLTAGMLAGVAGHTAADGLGGIDTLINIAGAQGGDFGDRFFGSDADEFFEPGGGDDTIDGGGGDGFDDVDYFSSTDGVIASLALQGQAQTISASQGKDTFTNIEGLDGSAFNDTLSGDGKGNFLQGRGGNDSLQGNDGDDRLRGGTGDDTIDGGGGFDQVDYFAAAAAVHVDLSKQGIAQTISAGEGKDTLFNIEDARGSAFNDTLIGNTGSNNLFGIDGNDSLNGGDGFDFLGGGKGNDIINGGLAGDFDEASFADAEQGAFVNLSAVMLNGVAAGTATDGLGGVDKLFNIGGIFGSDFNDTIVGGNAGEFFEGMGGDDSINGGGGFNVLEYFSSSDGVTVDLRIQNGVTAQTISASQGKDTILNISDVFGSLFNDTLIGNGSDNLLSGRDGDDRLVVLNNLFFEAVGGAGTDRLVLSGGVALSHQDVLNKLFQIEEIDLTTGSNQVTLTAQDVLDTSDTDVMQILGNSGDFVSSIGQGWNKGADQVIDGQTYHTYTSNQPGATVTLLVDADITQTITA